MDEANTEEAEFFKNLETSIVSSVVEDLVREREKIKEELDGITEELQPVKEQLDDFSEIREQAKKAYYAALEKILEEENAAKVRRRELNNEIRQKQALIDSTQRQIDQAIRAEHVRKKEEELHDQLTMLDSKWFTSAFPHQFEAAKKITLNRRMILADAPGLGKTLTALATVDLIKAATANARPDNPYGYDPENYIKGIPHQCGRRVLYVCPAPLLRNVLREVRMWTDFNAVLLGNQDKRTRGFIIDTLKGMEEFLVVINYEAWRKDKQFLEELIGLNFDTIILDEAHILKDRKTNAYKELFKLMTRYPAYDINMPEYNEITARGNAYYWNRQGSYYTPFVLAMTGTPILNKPQDLFSLLSIVDPDHFNNENYFLRDYCQQNLYTRKWTFRSGGLDSLAKRITNLYLRRTKRDAGIILPGKHEEIHELQVDVASYPDQARARQQMKQYGAILLGEDKTISAAAEIAIYTRLRQIEELPSGIEIKDENGTIQLKLDINESQKLDYIFSNTGEGLLADLTEGGIVEGSSVVVFSQFNAPLRELHTRLSQAGIRSVVLDGSTPQNIRDEIILDFDRRHTEDAQARWQVVLANSRVGGVGVTLTRATEMIILGQEWSFGKEEQASDRIHRIGQTEDVTIHRILMKGTIDYWMYELINSKKDLVSGFNDTMDYTSLRNYLMGDE